jgi:F0F1-type ATP synthase membrane subunit b/b'
LKRAILCIWLGLWLASYALPQEEKRETAPASEQNNSDPWIWWKWANFIILAGALGFLITKQAGAYFSGQSQAIASGIKEAAKVKQDAEMRVAQIEKRLAGLGEEVNKLRSTALAEMTSEMERIGQETERMVSRLHRQAEEEIELMTKAARQEIRVYSAGLAVQLAEQRIRAGLDTNTQTALANGFIQDLHSGAQRSAMTR